ncbi:MAG TPA: phosphatidate cytidylyltransferase, partial [Bacteroidales bacterium]|nr:phosphatidate cytidylyltransferase [Bacteroidales bacterium]
KKNRSRVWPGQGGFLNRLDSFLFALPAIFCYLVLTKLIIL